LTPYDLVDIAVVNGLHFHAATETHERADTLYRRTVEVLNQEYA
jgi:hypothetical protein